MQASKQANKQAAIVVNNKNKEPNTAVCLFIIHFLRPHLPPLPLRPSIVVLLAWLVRGGGTSC